jgi:hypothetical protein
LIKEDRNDTCPPRSSNEREREKCNIVMITLAVMKTALRQITALMMPMVCVLIVGAGSKCADGAKRATAPFVLVGFRVLCALFVLWARAL